MKHDRNVEYWQRAAKVMPLGTNSNFRFAGERTFFCDHAKGSHVWDVDGNEYIDYKNGFGPVILGHAFDEVDDKVREAMKLGVTYAAVTPAEIELAERFVRLCPCIEKLRLCSSGTEATMHALRVARAYTGRDKFIKFEGQYHGVHDQVLFSMYADPFSTYGSRRGPIPVLESAGVPKVIRELVVTMPFNDPEALELELRREGHQIAAILVEPILGNCAGIEPVNGFLSYLRQKCDEYGIVLIFDEVKTGFRVSLGGAQQLYGVTPDMATYGKAFSNGYVIAAFGGKAEIMDMLGPGLAEHAGTHNGHRVGVTAANATLEIMEQRPILQTIAERGKRLKEGLQAIFSQLDLPVTFIGHPAMFGWVAMRSVPLGQREFAESNQAWLHEVASIANEKGILLARETREPWFMSYSHSEEDIDKTLNLMEEVAREAKALLH